MRRLPILRALLLSIIALAAVILFAVLIRRFNLIGGSPPLPTTGPEVRPTPRPTATIDREARATSAPVATLDSETQLTSAPAATAAPELSLERVEGTELTDAQSPGPESFSVGNISYKVVNGALWFFGEVRNDGTESRESIAVRVNLLDAMGKEVASQTGYTSMSYLKQGEISSFSVLFTKASAPPPFASYTLEVRGSAASFQPDYTFRELRIDDETRVQRDGYGFINIDGRVRNTGAGSAQYARVFAVFYDAAGKVVGLDDAFAEVGADNLLAAGAEARFEIQGIIFTGEPVRYRLFAEGSHA